MRNYGCASLMKLTELSQLCSRLLNVFSVICGRLLALFNMNSRAFFADRISCKRFFTDFSSSRKCRDIAMRAGPPVMVNSCTGKMGHATAEAVVRAGLELIPYTFCGTSQGVAVGSIGVSGVPVERVSAERRDQVRSRPKNELHGNQERHQAITSSYPVSVAILNSG